MPILISHNTYCPSVVVFALYFVPAALYCAYNNLAFVNLANFDPTTYFLLLQFRVVITGVVFQVRMTLSGRCSGQRRGRCKVSA